MLGLYLHIPFCRQKCLYCDFCSFPKSKKETVENYVKALLSDIDHYGRLCEGDTVDTIFFGGGTPTVLLPEILAELLRKIKENFCVAKDAEITTECNPATVTGADLSLLRKAGFNRLSIGLQSTHENELKVLGRIHTYGDFLTTWKEAKQAGFERLSMDLMFGIPEQTKESFHETLERVMELEPKHLSTYSLILEEGTPMEREKEKLIFPSEEDTREMYLDAIDFLKKQGIKQYEISNFARTGEESRHNLRYWNQEEYLGIGVSAYSDFHGERFGFSRDIQAYIGGDRTKIDREILGKTERMNEYVMLQMRLRAGLSEKKFREKFDTDPEPLFGKPLQKYITGGFVEKTEDGYAFTPEGMLVSNTILSDILSFDKT